MFKGVSESPNIEPAAPPPPKDLDSEELFKDIHWYQKWEVFSGIFTPGINPIAQICDLMHLPADLSGRRVLDIGSANGCMSFECERRGAAEVIGLTPDNAPEWGYDKLREVLGSSHTNFRRGSVYSLDPNVLGYFDTVLFCGVLYHLRYPLLAIDNVRRVATSDVFVETHVSDYALPAGTNGIPLWKFYRFDELNNDHSNWFGPNATAVLEAFESAGFDIKLLSSSGHRARFKARVREGMPEFLNIPCSESARYDVLIRPLFGELDAWRRPIPS